MPMEVKNNLKCTWPLVGSMNYKVINSVLKSQLLLFLINILVLSLVVFSMRKESRLLICIKWFLRICFN